MQTLLDSWPPRRRVAAALLFPLVLTWFLVVGRSAGLPTSAVWHAVVVLAAALGAGVLATYVPEAGHRPDLGCTPCATLAGLTLVGATMALRSYGGDIAGPLVAAAVLLFGLTQRVGQPVVCSTPAR